MPTASELFRSAVLGNPADPNKKPSRSLAVEAIELLEESVAAAAQGVRQFATYAELAAVVTGLVDGQAGRVTADAGTHTDPVVGGTVDNEGEYRWSDSPAGWERIGDIIDAAALEAEFTTQIDAVSDYAATIASIQDEQATIRTVGKATTPVTSGTTTSNLTFAYYDPIVAEGYIKRIWCYSNGTGTLTVKRMEGDVGSLDQIGSSLVLTLADGLNEFDADDGDFTPFKVLAGERIAYHSGGKIRYTSATADNGGMLDGSVAGEVSSITDTTPQTSLQHEIGFFIYSFGESPIQDAIAADVTQLSAARYKTIGRSVPTTGSAVSNVVFVFAEPVGFTGRVVQIQAYSGGTGTLSVYKWDASTVAPITGDELSRGAASVMLPMVAGLNVWTAEDGDFEAFSVEPQDRLGFHGGTNLRFVTATEDSGGYWSPGATATTFAIPGAAQAGFQLQFGAVIEKIEPADRAITPVRQPWAIKAGYETNLDYDWVGGVGYGQSNEAAVDSDPAFSLTPSVRHLTRNVGLTMTMPGISGGANPDDGNVKALVESDTTMWTGQDCGETSWSTFARQFTARELARQATPTVMHVSTAARGSQGIATLKPGSLNYPNVVYHVQAAKASADADSKSYALSWVGWGHGETDMLNSVTESAYRGKFDTLVDTFATDVQTITGQTHRPIWLCDVSPYGITVSQGATWAILAACEERGDCHFVLPIYRCEFGNSVHLSNEGQALKGAYRARAADQIVQGRVPDRVWWRSAQFTGTTVTVIASAPTQMKFDAALTQEVGGNGTQATDYGIKVVDGTGTLTLSALTWGTAVYNPVTQLYDSRLTFTVNRALGTSPKFRYALDFLSPGRSITSGADGNIFDSTTETVTLNGTTYTLAHAAPPVELDIVEAE